MVVWKTRAPRRQTRGGRCAARSLTCTTLQSVAAGTSGGSTFNRRTHTKLGQNSTGVDTRIVVLWLQFEQRVEERRSLFGAARDRSSLQHCSRGEAWFGG